MISKSPRRPTSNVASSTSTIVLPPPSVLSSPNQVIDYYRRRGLQMDPSVDIEEIIKSNPEIRLIFTDLGINDAYIKRIAESSFEIGINSKHHPNRQKFSMAHEYAHYLLHRDKIDGLSNGEQILHRNSERNSIEYQANNFAAELLMPKYLVQKAASATSGSLKAMADLMGISQEALRYRVEDLGYKIG